MKKIIRLMFFPGLVAAVLFVSNSAYAEDSYQYEVGAQYHSSKEDNNNPNEKDIEVKVTGIGARVHFSEVNTAGHPLAEAAFLERVGSVAVQAGDGEIEGSFGGTDLDGDVTRYVAEVEFMRPDLPIVIKATLDKLNIDLNSPGEGEVETGVFNIGFGFFLLDGLRLGLSYGQEEKDEDITAPMVVDRTADYDDYAVEAKWVKSLSGGRSFNAEGSIGIRDFDLKDKNNPSQNDDGSNTIVGLSGDYYFTDSFSLGAGVMVNSGDDEGEEGDIVTFNLTNFFSPRFYVNVDYEKFHASEDSGQDETGWDILFSARF